MISFVTNSPFCASTFQYATHIYLAAGAQSSPLPQPVLSAPSLYPRAFYLYLMASNLLLRLGWTYKLSDTLRTSALVPLLFAVVEVLRWVGWELRWGIDQQVVGCSKWLRHLFFYL